MRAVLPDRAAVAGIGNIYADEVLYRARIHPYRPAVGSGGTSFAGYVSQSCGSPGYPGRARVFRGQGLPGEVGGRPVIRATVAGRAVNYRPPLPPEPGRDHDSPGPWHARQGGRGRGSPMGRNQSPD